MPKQGKVLPARRQRDTESLLLRSAESLGRIIASLQRELDEASGWLSKGGGRKTDLAGGTRKPSPNGSGARKTRTAAGESAAARPAGGRSRTGAQKSADPPKPAARKTTARQAGGQKPARRPTRGR
jgi:hypothetical protein